ncbi:MAG: hypothetical protein ED557_07610 [Balneola sp.]|nr:MAG: hypothetical protein ED557_07610 [Balneola sp.]
MKIQLITFYLCLSFVAFFGCKKESGVLVFEDDPSEWSIDPSSYQHYMSVVAFASSSSDTSDILAAFHDNDLQGFTTGEVHQGRVIHFLLVYNNQTTGKIGFRLYQSGEDRVIGSVDSISFNSGAGLGTPDNPYEIEF